MRTSLPFARGAEGDRARFLISVVITSLLGWWFLAVNAAGEISMRMGSRAARGYFDADRMTDPDQFNAALAFIGLLFLAGLAAVASTVRDIVAASGPGARDEEAQ